MAASSAQVTRLLRGVMRTCPLPPARFYRSVSAPRPRIVTIGRARVGVVTVDQRVEVRLLGPPHVLREGELVGFDTRKATALLAHLAVSRRPRPRDALADLLWPDADLERARGALRRTLSTLRSGIGAEHVEATRDHVRLVRGDGLRVDVDEFRRLREAGDLAAAVGEYRGDLLEGFAVRDAPGFEDWCAAEAAGERR
jgi:DNA-binding SARP family transcriptional activator